MKSYKIILMVFCGVLLTVPVKAEDELNAVLSKIEKVEKDLTVLQRQVYRFNVTGETPKSAKTTTGEVPENYSDYLTSRMDLIDETLSMITNQVEELQFKTNKITERLDRIVKDVEFRFNELENKDITTPKNEAKSETKTEKPVVREETATENPEKLYSKAYDELKKSNYVNAEKYLSLFVEKYPEHELAGNAQYWLGETFYVRGDFEKSAVTFAKCYEKYGKSNKGADCLLKLGLSMSSLKKTKEACVAFKSMNKEYPKAVEPIKKRTEAEIKRLNCK